jgi:hypothetical protein
MPSEESGQRQPTPLDTATQQQQAKAEQQQWCAPQRPQDGISGGLIAYPIAVALDQPCPNMFGFFASHYPLPDLGTHISCKARIAVSDRLTLTGEAANGLHQSFRLALKRGIADLPIGIRGRWKRRLRQYRRAE